MSDASKPVDLKPASKCPTPQKPKTSSLPEVDDIDPLDFEAAGGLQTFQGLQELSGTADAYSEFSDLTPAQLYELNQQLLNDSVPIRPLIDDVAPMSSLRVEYENGSASFLKQIDWLQSNGYESVRRTRGDGDCFYRSLAFAYVDGIIHSNDREMAVTSSLSSIHATKPKLEEAGIERLVFEDFLDEFTSLIENIVKPNADGTSLTLAGLLEAFQNPEVSNAIVIYLRFLTSAQIRLNREAYESFLVHPDTKDLMDVDSFCANVVQAMGKEADNVEIDALCKALQLNVNVAYLNGGSQDSVDLIKFRNDPNLDASPLVLLYRPGHYDILIGARK